MFELSVEIYIICDKTDIRYGEDSLAWGLRSFGIENSTIMGTLYFFGGRRTDRIRGRVWENAGSLVMYKKLVIVYFSGCVMQANLKDSHQYKLDGRWRDLS